MSILKINLKNIFKELLEYLLMFLVIFYGQTIWLWMLPYSERHYIIDYASFLVVLLLIIINRKVEKKIVINAMLFGLFLVAYSIIASYNIRYITLHFIAPFILFYVYLAMVNDDNRLNDLLKKFANLVLVLATLSLLCYVFGTLLSILPYSYDRYQWTGYILTAKNYLHLMYESQQTVFFGIRLIRNCGIFCEAPSYAVPLLLALAYELFLVEKIRKMHIVILILTMITTYSSKSLVIASIAIALWFIRYALSTEEKSIFKQLTRIVLPAIVILSSIVSFSIIDMKSDGLSYAMRIDDIQACLQAFKRNVIFGVGPGNEKAITRFSLVITEWQGLSMGIPTLLAEGGVCLTAFYLCGLIHAVKNSRNKYTMVSIGIIHILILFSSNIPYFLSTVFILAIEYSLKKD